MKAACRRVIAIIATAAVVISLCSCSDDGKRSVTGGSPTVDDILKGGGQTDFEGSAAAPETAVGLAYCTTDVDVDLTVLSGTMVYSEVYNMMSMPDPYIGRSVRMNGVFAVYIGDGINYYAVIIADATACCKQGLEFVLVNDSELTFPDDYPTVGSIVTVRGIFETYTENGYKYCRLREAVFE